MSQRIAVDEVEYSYQRGTQVLRGLTFGLDEGLHFLLGVNGAGKTTLFRLLLGSLAPAAGSVTVGDGSGPEQLGEVGYLPQSFSYPGHITVRQFVRYVAWLRRMKKPDAAVAKAIAQVGLTDRSDAKLSALSGGMLRRAGIAQAIVHQPRILLLDEPTSGLDPAQRVDLRVLLNQLSQSMCVLVSTHLMEDAQQGAGDVLILHDGAIRYQGRSADVESTGAGEGHEGLSPLEQYFLRITRN